MTSKAPLDVGRMSTANANAHSNPCTECPDATKSMQHVIFQQVAKCMQQHAAAEHAARTERCQYMTMSALLMICSDSAALGSKGSRC